MSGGTAPVAARGGAYLADGASLRAPLCVVLAALLYAVGAFAPSHFLSEFALRIGAGGLLLGILALSVAFLMNQAGLVALGAASVYGGVGYLFAIAMSEWDLSPTPALLLAFAAVVVYSAALGALIVRTNPLAFMMLTLAAGEMISHSVMLEGLRDYTSGADGLVVGFKGAVLGMSAADFANATQFWPIAWSAAWLLGLAAFALRRSRFGAIVRAIRENEERMRFSGFGTYLPRLAAFVFVNAIAGVCGLLHVLNSGFVSPESLGLGVSTNALVAALIGGVASSTGPIVGGVLFAVAQDQFGARGFTQLLTGLAIVVFIVVFPRGVIGGLIEAARRSRRRGAG
ncbi:MAG: branched-chain amino acid ABC transporter permease [Pseudomonadota bacterium]|nr:branched-chain amino acid ABC transporter permease [Pseudomonadota bacterium]